MSGIAATVALVRWVAACLPSEPTTPLGYVIAPSSVPSDAGASDAQALEAGPAGRAIAEPPP
jgi:hypothetical protein